MPIRIVLIHSHELIRHGLRYTLESEEDMQVVGDYANADEASVEMTRVRGDITLMGTQTLGMSWIDAVRGLKGGGLHRAGNVIILADSLDYRDKALEAGATSYLLSDVTHEELVKTIRQVYRNRDAGKERGDLTVDVVELVVARPPNAANILRFMCQLSEIFDDDFGSIICTVGSWDRDSVITVRAQPASAPSLPVLLASMPEVEKVEEEPIAAGVFASFQQKIRLLPRPGINPSKRIHITLKETSMAGGQLDTADYTRE